MLELSDDDTRAEFARLRETTLHDIRLPGTEKLRQTLIRRRRQATAAYAGLAVVLVAGGAAVALASPDRSPSPSLPAAASGYETAETVVADAPTEMVLKDWFPPEGRFAIEVTCTGTGSGTVTLKAGEATSSKPITCGTPTELELDVPKDTQSLTMSIDWDPGAEPEEGHGIRVRGVPLER